MIPSRGLHIARRAFSQRITLLRQAISKRHASSVVVSDEVREAVAAKQPVVALESTIYTHGLPYPENLELASHLSATIRKNGAIAATCAVIDGIARVGLEERDLRRLIETKGARKVSRRDLAYVTSKRRAGQGLNGGTTISGTMILAHLAGIHVFATGGLGGVHRGGESSLDISADLTELGRTPVAVISSGPKGFLDIPRTLEYLETQGVHVSTFADGREGAVEFPAFWARDSGIKSPLTVHDEAEAAAIIHAHISLPLTSGLLLANPVPAQYSIPREEMTDIIDRALQLAVQAGATGNANTPFVLNAIKELSNNRSVPANKALVEANVIRGAKVAVELSRIQRSEEPSNYIPSILIGDNVLAGLNNDLHRKSVDQSHASQRVSSNVQDYVPKEKSTSIPPEIVVAGSLAVDLSCDYLPSPGGPQEPQLHTSNPSQISDSLGGVGNNIARAAHLLGTNVRLCTAIADDLAGCGALQALQDTGLDISGIQILPTSTGARTARYIAINDAKKDLVMAVSDMSIIEHITPASITQQASSHLAPPGSSKPSWLIVDGNWSPDTLHAWLSSARTHSIPTAFEPVSTAKSLRLLSSTSTTTPTTYPHPTVSLATPNSLELTAMHTAARSSGLLDRQDWWIIVDAFGIPSSGATGHLTYLTSPALVTAGIPQRALQLLPFIPTLATKLGADGVMLTMLLGEDDPRLSDPEAAPYILSRSGTGEQGVGGVYMRLFPAAEEVPEGEVVSVSGCGDTFLGALVAGMLTEGRKHAGMGAVAGVSGGRGGNGSRIEDVVMFAQRAACLTLRSKETVAPELRAMAFQR